MILYFIYLKVRRNRLMLKTVRLLILYVRYDTHRKFYIPILNNKVKILPNTSRTFLLKVYVAMLLTLKIF